MVDKPIDEVRDGGGSPVPPRTVTRLDGAGPARLAALTAAFDDLQYVLMCCEHLVAALDPPAAGPSRGADPALVEALWTGALVGYVRAFSGRLGVLTDADVTSLELGDQTLAFHAAMKRLRDHYASRHVNPRETITVGVAVHDDGSPHAVAVTSAPQPDVDAATVRMLGRVAYALSDRIDARMCEAQEAVLEQATAMPRHELRRLPQYEVLV